LLLEEKKKTAGNTKAILNLGRDDRYSPP